MATRLRLHGSAWIQSRRKRICDLCLCLIVLPIALITFISAAMAVWRQQPKAVFLRQERIGRHGSPFIIHKIHSMPLGQNQLTPLGALLSILGADETPQLLYDIWRGTMATIGPRPLIAKDFVTMRHLLGAEKYTEWYQAYTMCRPGWMGVFSQRSRTYIPQSPEYLYARYLCDTIYIEHARFSLDIFIFLKSLTMWCTDIPKLRDAILELFAPKLHRGARRFTKGIIRLHIPSRELSEQTS